MTKNKKMSSKYISFGLIILIVLSVATYLIYTVLNPSVPVNKVEEISNIPNWGYTLDDRDTSLMKGYFDELKGILKKDEIDYKEYAEVLSKLYVTDMYTLNNKINSYDVPCLEYVEPTSVDNFKLNIMDTLYKNIIDNSDKKRTQTLPEVSNVLILSNEETTYKLNDQELDGYKIELSISYVTDLDYDEEVTLTIVKIDKKLYIVKQESKVSDNISG